MKSNKMLEIINVSKFFGKFNAIKDINLTVYSGEVFGFLGPNGAGKSTTIKMITGLLPIDKGDILINNNSINTNFEEAIKNVGAIVETPDLYDYLSGYDNLKLIARLYKVNDENLNEIVEIIGLKSKIKEKVKKYSLGMKQRLGLGVALIRQPKLLILDEPTNGLDPEGIHKFRDILKDLAHNKGVCVFVSSHLLSEMQLMCDRVAIINKGQIIKVEKTNEIVDTNITLDKKDIYELITQSNDKAKDILIKNDYKLINDSENDNKLIIAISKEQISKLINLLADNNILTYEVTRKKQTLEDVFLSITNGGSINE